MKLGSVFIAAAFLASSSAWAGIANPVSVNKVSNLKFKVVTVQTKENGKDKVKKSNVKEKDVAETLCGGPIEKKQALAAFISCPIDAMLEQEGFVLGVWDENTNAPAEGCGFAFVDLFDFNVALDKEGAVKQVNGIISAEYLDESDGTWTYVEASAEIKAKNVKDKEKYGPVAGMYCVHKVKTKSLVGAQETEEEGDNPIEKGEITVGSVDAGTNIVD